MFLNSINPLPPNTLLISSLEAKQDPWSKPLNPTPPTWLSMISFIRFPNSSPEWSHPNVTCLQILSARHSMARCNHYFQRLFPFQRSGGVLNWHARSSMVWWRADQIDFQRNLEFNCLLFHVYSNRSNDMQKSHPHSHSRFPWSDWWLTAVWRPFYCVGPGRCFCPSHNHRHEEEVFPTAQRSQAFWERSRQPRRTWTWWTWSRPTWW